MLQQMAIRHAYNNIYSAHNRSPLHLYDIVCCGHERYRISYKSCQTHRFNRPKHSSKTNKNVCNRVTVLIIKVCIYKVYRKYCILTTRRHARAGISYGPVCVSASTLKPVLYENGCTERAGF